MKITSIRHGESKRNREKIIQEQIAGELTKEGINQSRKLAHRLSKESFDKIYCSDAQRAKETAKEIIKFHLNVPIEYTEELREMNAGENSGLSWIEDSKRKEKSNENFAKFKPKDGESIMEIVIRINNFINKLYKKHKGEHILLITHGGTNKSLKHLSEKGLIEPIREKGYEQDNCCVNIVEYSENGSKLILYNCVKHLV